MIHHTQIDATLDTLNPKTIITNKKIQYLNLPCGFDIETSSVVVNDEKAAFMYIWMIALGENTPVYYGRTWEEFQSVCEKITAKLELSESRRLVVYVHNLGYEFQFMRHYFEWSDVFAVSERKPIKALTMGGIEFRDSYILSGYSLANTAKNLTTRKVAKLEGDLDYKKIRHHETPMTDAEMGYCENDVLIIIAYIAEQIDLYNNVTKIPATNTGRVRQYVRDECYYTSKNHRKSSKSKFVKYRKIMDDLTLDSDTYGQLKRAFMGGFTHANANHSGKTLKDVSSIDFTSSYPSVMVSEQFPMSRFKEVDIESTEDLEQHCHDFAMVFDVKFNNIRCILEQETYLSESKCLTISKPTLDNGRVVEAESLTTTLTDVDYQIMCNVYEWDSMEIANAKMAYKAYLPKSIIKSILDLYQKKTELKDVAGSETEYMLSKGMLNSIYGMCVTDIVKDNSIYVGEWDVEKVDVESEISEYNKSKTRFLYYAWGLWVTAYARRNLWTGIMAVGNDYIYSDTDSLKMFNYESHADYINWFNETIVEKMELMCDYYEFDKKLLSPKTKTGKVKMLGVWDYEGTYDTFKTLGAKRYMSAENGKLAITVAGLSKQNGINYMREQCDNDIDRVFAMFDDSLYIPANRTGKMTHTYIDSELKFKIQDYTGVTETVNPMSGIHLGDCDFTLSIASHYRQFLNQLKSGKIFKGVKHQ